MNADELAKGLDQFSNLGGDFFGKCANMLRQQSDRIAELEKECHWAKDQWDKDRICFKARIAELEKELYFKNYYEELPNTPIGIIGKIGDSPIHDLVHRATPQIKELSDEEIQEISHDFGEIAWLGETTYKFARAILKKASEK